MTKLDELIQEFCPTGVEYCELGEILTIKNGSDYKHLGTGKVPVYGSGGIMTYVDQFSYDKPSVLIPRKGSVDKLCQEFSKWLALRQVKWKIATIYMPYLLH